MPNVICPICRDILGLFVGPPVAAMLCGHVFHENCVRTWLRDNTTCPSCRYSSTTKEGLKLYFEAADETSGADNSEEHSQLTAKYETALYELNLKNKHNLALTRKINQFRRDNELLRNQIQNYTSGAEKYKQAIIMQTNELKKIVEERNRQCLIIKTVVKERNALKVQLAEMHKQCSKFTSIKNLLESNSEELDDADYNLLDTKILRAVISSLKKNLKTVTHSEQVVKNELGAVFYVMKKYQSANLSLKEELSLKCEIIEAMKRQDKEKNGEPSESIIDTDAQDSNKAIVKPSPPPLLPLKRKSTEKEALNVNMGASTSANSTPSVSRSRSLLDPDCIKRLREDRQRQEASTSANSTPSVSRSGSLLDPDCIKRLREDRQRQEASTSANSTPSVSRSRSLLDPDCIKRLREDRQRQEASTSANSTPSVSRSRSLLDPDCIKRLREDQQRQLTLKPCRMVTNNCAKWRK